MKLTRARASKHPNARPDIGVARQPIFGTAGDVAGYGLVSCHSVSDPRRVAATDVVVKAIVSIGLEQLTAGRAAYVGFTPDMLIEGAYTTLPRDGVVVELLGTMEPDDRVEFACEQLVNAGYTLALDDCAAGYSERLLELATVVKVDVHDLPPERLDAIAQELAVYDVRLLAVRVATRQMRALCAGLGYELFHGNYYARAEMVQDRTLRSDELAIVRALNALRDAQASDAESVFATDRRLAARLLRVLNADTRAGGIESVQHALRLGARQQLGTWLLLFLAWTIAAREPVTRELLHLAMQRARLCELLAGSAGRPHDGHSMFVVGLFSLLDVVAGMPMDTLLGAVAVDPLVRAALRERTGPYAVLLTIAEAWEQGDWTTVRRHAWPAGIDASGISALYLQSLVWSREHLRVVNASAA